VEQELTRLRAGACDKHKDKQVKLYCHQCNENICLMCFAIKHINHENGEIPEVADDFRSRIDDNGQQVLSAVSALRHQSEIKRSVDKQVGQLVSELRSLKSDTAKQAQAVQDRLQLALVAMESFLAYSRELLDKGRPSDVTRAASKLHIRATELLKTDVTTFDFRPPFVTFTPADVTQLSGSNIVGQVSVENKRYRRGSLNYRRTNKFTLQHCRKLTGS